MQEEKRQVDRKRHLLTLMSRYLVNNGYIESAERLQAESGVSLAKFDTADNMDLYMILQVRFWCCWVFSLALFISVTAGV